MSTAMCACGRGREQPGYAICIDCADERAAAALAARARSMSVQDRGFARVISRVLVGGKAFTAAEIAALEARGFVRQSPGGVHISEHGHDLIAIAEENARLEMQRAERHTERLRGVLKRKHRGRS